MVAMGKILGALGALVLVGALVGGGLYVFRDDAPAPADDIVVEPSAFEKAYPSLAADEDLDGDGVPNGQDGDIDGDDVKNEEDLDVVVQAREIGVVLGAHMPPAVNAEPVSSSPQSVGTNVTTLYVQVTYSATVPEKNTVRMVLVGPDGADVAEGVVIPKDPANARVTNPVKLAVEVAGPVPAGDYTVRVEQIQPSHEVKLTFFWTLTYVEAQEYVEPA